MWQEVDPGRFFANSWTDAVLGVGGNAWIVRTYCALEGLCISPRTSTALLRRATSVVRDTEARVCRFDG